MCGSKGGALDERGKPFRRSTFGRKWRKARSAVGLPDAFRLYDLRHTGHTLTTRSGATLKDTMVRAGQSTEKAALIYQHSYTERQREVASGLDSLVQPERRDIGHGTGARRLDRSRQQTRPKSLTWAFVVERVTRIELAL
ncbi:hypothetical protein [Streptomyces sp. NPDC059209]|uniref:hypothetical protein n=1 Tax=Streptomyces sp. NPDC059209 TaxID=3346769 RepID=UPI0036A9A75B